MPEQKIKDISIDAIPRPVKTYHSQTYDRISPSKTTFKAKGKTVLVTAGATGVGFSISQSFAQAGVERIIIISRRAEPRAEAKAELENLYPETKVETIQCSVTDSDGMANILEQAGGIDVLVLSAAASHTRAGSLDIPFQEIQEVFDTNVVACYELVKTYLRLPPPPSGEKTIINISSASAHLYIPGQSVYAASKTAFAQILSFIAAEHTPKKDGVRIFSMHPGVFYTDMVAKKYEYEDANWEDIRLPGHFAVWLASPEADLLHGRFVWAHWDVDELVSIMERFEREPMFLKMGLVM